MAASLSLHVHSFLITLLLFCCNCSAIRGGGRTYHVIRTDSMKPMNNCSSSAHTRPDDKRMSLPLVHRYGPCSPVVGHERPTLEQILHQDQLRVNHLQHKLSTELEESEASLPASLGTPIGTSEYVVTVGYGTPMQPQSLIIDTGSDLCWIQCQPCLSCYQTEYPIYDPSKSSSYSNITCDSQECGQLGKASCTNSTDCGYSVEYGDLSSSAGVYSYETLTLSPANVFPRFVFGCGQANQGLFRGTTGILGLGRGGLSLVSQTAQTFGKVFSYCLPSPSSSTGYLAFNGGTAASTPMLSSSSNPSLYFINLVGISVQGEQLPISPSVFSSTGTIIDSGTVITRLPPQAYKALRSAFQGHMSEYPTAPSTGGLDTCYNFSGYETVTMPTISLHFDGNGTTDVDSSRILVEGCLALDPGGRLCAKVKLPTRGMHFDGSVTMDIDSSGILLEGCLAFAEANGLGIIGNVQQRTIGVVYDLGKQTIGFQQGRSQPCR